LEPYVLIVGMENGAATLENSLSVPEKVKHKKFLYDPAFPLLGIYLKELKIVLKYMYIYILIGTLFIIPKGRNNPNVHQLKNE